MAKPATRSPSKSGAKVPQKGKANPAPASRTSGQAGKSDIEAARQETLKTEALQRDTADGLDMLTTNQGLPVGDDQNSLKAGERGPTLLEDFHLREKITHFDHERIPERVVHARGAAAHGYFQVYEDLSHLTKAKLFRDPSKQTPVFVRFSTVAGSRGSADTPRDVRGFRRQVLHGRRRLGSRRQQHPRLLHSGCDQVSGLHPCRQARAEQRDPPGRLGA